MEEDLITDVGEHAFERDPSEELDIVGQGTRRLQIIQLPREESGWAYEFIFTEQTGWMVGRSKAFFGERDRVQLSGYERLRVLGDALMGIHQKITSVTFPMFIPPVEETTGPDALFYELAVWGGHGQTIRLKWRGTATEGGWDALTEYIMECLFFLEGLPIDDRPLPGH